MVTIAGAFSFTVCKPPSTSRVTVTLSPSIASLEAKVPCAQPSSAASIWPVWLQSSSIACLPRMTRPGFSASTMALRIFATASGSTGAVGLHQDAAVGAHGERGADGFRRLRRADRHRHDLGRLAGFLQPDRLFDGDLVERIHRHLDVGEFDAGAVRLDADLDVEIDHPFHGHQNFHESPSQTGANRSGRKLMAAPLACQRLCCGARKARLGSRSVGAGASSRMHSNNFTVR